MSAEPATATRTYLELTDPAELRRGRQPDVEVQIARRDPCEPSFWRHLYATVGAAYRWFDRLPWTDEDIQRYLDDPAVSLWVMTIGGEIAGYYELRREPPSAEHRENDSFEIVYFGLMPAFTGRGLGAFMLTDAVDRAWSLGARRVWLHTCTFDHPHAIPNYIDRGFRVFKTEEYRVSPPLWTPSPERVAQTRLTAFMRLATERYGISARTYSELYQFSIDRPEDFWRLMWEFGGVRGTMGERVVADLDRMPGARFFPDATLNFADNLLTRRDAGPAIISKGEDRGTRSMSWAELHDAVTRVAAALRREGVKPGDRVAAYLPNIPETIVAALGAAAVGAVWSSCSPDFGVQGVVDRLGQIEPVIFLAVDGYSYAGKRHDCMARVAEIARALPSVRRTVVVSYIGTPVTQKIANLTTWHEFTSLPAGSATRFEPLPFNHPLYILYSSGTTGVPKCIVHGAGGTLIQHLKEHQLHSDVRAGDRVFYFTTCGWMMWNWLVSALASEATLVLYEGSPFHPDGHTLFELADEAGVTLFGVSARFIDAVSKAGIVARASHPLDSVRTITSTGSPLAPESFDFVYDSIKPDVHLASISGGTDIVGLFAGGNPNGSVWRGELQARALGMKVDVFDEEGRSLRGQKGELVCTMPFPSMPVEFWNDPDGRKYHAAYFARFPGVWHHGDYVELTAHDGLIIYGRSDAVLNPGGVRIGTAEIYRQVEQLDEIVESLVVGQQWQGDERVVLFVRLREGVALDRALEDRIRRQIRESSSPRHVPAVIVAVTDIPRTKSGKLVEIAVRDVVHGRDVKNREALANPEALEQFRNRPELG